MIIVKPQVEVFTPPTTPEDMMRHVELCGRVCYKSEARITEDSAQKFIDGILHRGHEAVLEHGRITLANTFGLRPFVSDVRGWMQERGMCDYMTMTDVCTSGNIRAWRALIWFALRYKRVPLPTIIWSMMYTYSPFFVDILIEYSNYNQPLCVVANLDPQQFSLYERRVHGWYTVKFICDRGVSHEIVRHRPASYCQESTRYCNYSKGDFNGQITVIEPRFFEPDTSPYQHWKQGCEAAEKAYFDLLNDGCSPQQARTVLPNSLKTELFMTATVPEWQHFLKLRTAEAAHPQMREVATQVREKLAAIDVEVFGGVSE